MQTLNEVIPSMSAMNVQKNICAFRGICKRTYLLHAKDNIFLADDTDYKYVY